MAVTDHVTETPKTSEELRLEEEKKRQEEADARKQQKEDGYEGLAQGRGKKTTYNDYNKMFRWTADPALAKTLGMQEQKDVKEAAGTAALIQGMQLAGAASMYLSPQDIDNRKKKAALKERVAQGKHGLTDAQRDAMEREYMDPAKTFASSGQRDVEAALASQGGVAGTSAKNLVRGQREKDQRLLEMAHKASGKLSKADFKQKAMDIEELDQRTAYQSEAFKNRFAQPVSQAAVGAAKLAGIAKAWVPVEDVENALIALRAAGASDSESSEFVRQYYLAAPDEREALFDGTLAELNRSKKGMPPVSETIPGAAPPPAEVQEVDGAVAASAIEKGWEPTDEERRLMLPIAKRGQTGAHIKLLQDRLIIEGYEIDISGRGHGTFGPQTEAAVREFQKANGLKNDGDAGPIVWEVLAGEDEPITPK